MRKLSSAIDTAERNLGLKPSIASRYIKQLSIVPGQRFVVCCRASRRQAKNNLLDQEKRLREAIEAHGGIVAAVVMHGGKADGPGWDPGWLIRAAKLAKEHSATLVAESTDRFIRHPSFRAGDRRFRFLKDSVASLVELNELKSCTNGVRLMTLLHPEATPREVRAYQRQRGKLAKGSKNGRPRKVEPGFKKRIREEKLSQAIKMHSDGCSLRQIGEALGVSHATVQGWIRKHA